MNTRLEAFSSRISSLLTGNTRKNTLSDFEVLAEIGRTVTNPFSTPDVFDLFARLVNEVIRFDRIVITAADSEGDIFRLAYVYGTEVSNLEQGDVISLRNSFVAEVISQGNPARFSPSIQTPQKFGFVSAGLLSRIGTPLRSNAQVIGTLHLASIEPNAYSEHDLVLLEQIGNQVSGTLATEFLLESEQTKTGQLNAWYEVAAILAQAQSFEMKAQQVLDTLVRITEVDQAVLRRTIEGTDDLRIVSPAHSKPTAHQICLGAADDNSIPTRAYLQGTPIIVNNYPAYPDAQAEWLAQGFESVCSIPIKSGGETQGVLSVGSKTLNHFNSERVALLLAFVDEIVPLFEAVILSESLYASREELALVDEVARLLSSTLKVQDVYERFALGIKKLVGFDRVTIATIDQDARTITVKYTFGDTLPGRKVGDVAPLIESESYAVLELGLANFRGDLKTATDSRSPVDTEYLALGFCSSAVVPLMSRGQLIGTIGLRSRQEEAFGPREQAIILRLADQIASAIENAILFEQSVEYQEIQRHLADENEVMAKIGRIIASPISDADVYRQLTDAIRGLIEFDRISITILDAAGEYTSSEHILGTNVPGCEQGAVKRMDGDRVPFISKIMTSESPLTLNPRNVNDLHESYPTLVDFYNAGLRSFVGFRLITNDRVVGTIQLASCVEGRYGPGDSQLIERIGNQIAGSIASSMLLLAERERTRQLEALYGVAAIVARPQTFESKAQAIVETLVDFGEVDYAIVRRIGEDRGTLDLVATASSGSIDFQPESSISSEHSISSQAFHDGRPLIIDDYRNFSNDKPPVRIKGVASTLIMPIVSGGQRLGLLSVISRNANHFNGRRVELLTAFADEIVPLFESAILSDSLQASQGELTFADEIARIVTAAVEVEEVYGKFASEMRKLVGYGLAGVVKISEDQSEFTIRYLSGDFGGLFQTGKAFPVAGTITSSVIGTKDTVIVGDMAEHGGLWPTTHYLNQGIHSVIAAPLMSDDLVYGSLFLTSRRVNAFGVREQAIVQRLANQIAPAMKNAELHENTRKLSIENAAMAEIGRIVASPLSEEVVYRRFADSVRELIPFDRITITTLDSAGEVNLNAYTIGKEVPNWQQYSLNRLDGNRVPFITKIISMEHPLCLNPKDANELKESYPTLVDFYEAGLRSFIGCRLIADNRIIGTLQIHSSISGHYGLRESQLLERIGNQVAGSIASATLRVAERDRIHQLEAMYEVAAIKAQPVSFEAKAQRIVETLVQISEADQVFLRIADDNYESLELVATAGSGKISTIQSLAVSANTASNEAFRNGRQLIIDDYREFPGALRSMLDQGVGSVFVNPITSDGKTIGLLSLVSTAAFHFNRERIALLTAFGDEIGSLFDTAGLINNLQESREEMALVDEISRIVTATFDVEKVYDKFASELKKLVDYDLAGVIIITEDRSEVAIRYLSGDFGPAVTVGDSFPFAGSVTARVVDAMGMVIAGNVEQHKEIWPSLQNLGDDFTCSITVPLISDNSVYGTFFLTSRRANAFGVREQIIVQRLANQISPALKNAELYDESQRLAYENASMAEIGRIIAAPVFADGVYEKLGAVIGNLIPFDRIAITSCGVKGESNVNYHVRGKAVTGWEQGFTYPLNGNAFASEITETRRSIAFNPTSFNETEGNYPNLAPFYQAGLRSFLGSPLVTNDQVIGTIFLSSATEAAYTAREADLLQRIGNQVAGSIHNTTLLQSERDRTNQLEALYAVAGIMAQPLQFESKCEAIVETLVAATDVNKVVLRRVVEGTEELELVAVASVDDSATEATLFINNRLSAAGDAFREGRPIVINNYQNHPNAQPAPLARGLKSAISIPVKSGGRTLGLLSMGSMTANHFSDDRVALLTAFADEVGALFDAAGLSNVIQASREEMALVDEIANIVTSITDFEELGNRLTAQLKKLVEFDHATLATIDREASTITIKYSFGRETPGHESGRVFPIGRVGDLTALGSGKSTFRNNLSKDAINLQDKEYLEHGYHSSAVVPLISQGNLVGTIALRSLSQGAYGPKEQGIITRLANQIAPAVENAILHEQAMDSKDTQRRLTEELAARNEEMALVDRIADIISSSKNIEVGYARFSEELKKLIDFDRIVVNVIDHKSRRFCARFVAGTHVKGREQGALHGIRGTVVEKLIKNSKTLVREDLRNRNLAVSDHRYITAGLKASIGIPLISNYGVVATLHVHSKRSGAFGDREQGILERVASQITPVVENSMLQEQALDSEQARRRLADELTARTEEIALVDRIADIVKSSAHIDDVYAHFSDELKTLINFDRIAVNHIEPDLRTFTIRFVDGIEIDGSEQGSVHRYNGTLQQRLIQEDSSIVRNDIREMMLARLDEQFIMAGLRSSIGIPMVSMGILATLHIQSKQVSAFGPREQVILERLAMQITPAIANALSNDALAKGEARNRALLETTSDAIITIDERGIIQSSNPSAEAIFGYSAAELIGQNVKILMPESDMAEHDGRIARYVATGEERIIGESGRKLEARHKDGAIFPMDLWIGVIESDHDKGFIGIIRRLDQPATLEESGYQNGWATLPNHDERPRLTNREIEVLNFLAGGGRNKDIAVEMTVSLHTVKFHIENLYTKLDVRTRGELIRVATRFGLLTE